MMIHT